MACGVAVAAVLMSGCLPVVRATPRSADYARRLVVALDGVDHRDVAAARERGLFAGFRAPSRLISTFPSISDIAWHEILRVQPPRGYQRIFYSLANNQVIGGALDAIRPIEFEMRMDMAFGAKFHHLGAYLISNTVARREVDDVVKEFFTFTGRSTVYVYNVGPDALQHTRGDLERYLRHLDMRLAELQRDYQARTGRPLEIVLLSDHGHNRAVDAKFLPLTKALEARGFRGADRLRTSTDVAFSVDGVTTGFGVFVLPDSVASVARLLSELDGVDVVTTRVNDSVFTVQSGRARARIDRRTSLQGDLYRYVALDGDPLGYEPLRAPMQAANALDAEGFADADAWVRHTASAPYPAAVVRIVRGHTVVTLNPAPILVSLSDAYRVGLGTVSIANRLRPLGGTHGALSATNSLGVVMTNFVDTHDDLTASVHKQFGGFDDLGPEQMKSSGARLTTAVLANSDARGPFSGLLAGGPLNATAASLEVWLTPAQLKWTSARGMFFVEVRRLPLSDNARGLITTSYLPLPADTAATTQDGWVASRDRQHYVIALSRVLSTTLDANAGYQLRVILDRPEAQGSDVRSSSRLIASLTVRTNAKGELWPY